MKATTYSETIDYLDSHIHRAKDPHEGSRNIRRTKYLLRLLGNPQDKYPTIHIGGTSGKSSTSFFIAKILQESGYKTGLTISPHLQVATERIQINGYFASEKEFVGLINEIKPVVEKIEEEKRWGKVGYFQILLAAAFLYFARSKVDVAIVEVGIGGHYDATNVIKPVLAVITNVGLDHTSVLGETIEEIARDKREIIKKGVPIITGASQKSVINLLREKAERTDAPFIVINTKGQMTYSKANAILAQTAAEQLKKIGFTNITRKNVNQVLATTFLPGRLEIVSRNPIIILDAAHNIDKMHALVASLQNLFPESKFDIILARAHRKHLKRMIKSLHPITKKLFLTGIKDSAKTLKKVSTRTPNGKILITGSFFLVDQIRSLYYPKIEVLEKRRYYTKVTSIPS
ncbi:MAG: hypothetical protein HY377_00155 [Candidatus Blackburnbacteria bacterium]|nr:hypothetical protein [Candidatus Blackburnbacteria bacterium]